MQNWNKTAQMAKMSCILSTKYVSKGIMNTSIKKRTDHHLRQKKKTVSSNAIINLIRKLHDPVLYKIYCMKFPSPKMSSFSDME